MRISKKNAFEKGILQCRFWQIFFLYNLPRENHRCVFISSVVLAGDNLKWMYYH